MDDNNNRVGEKMNLPPMPPGFTKPGSPTPPVPPAFQRLQGEAQTEESARNIEKDKFEKRIAEMEKVVSQEKEKALLAELKNQQDEALSSKVESSLKDIQDRLRRDRREQETQEERISLKSKIKDLEARLVAERETWMQTLKGQIRERETQSKDEEGHFLYRLQEMERRWLEEKAQWLKTVSQKEDEVRSLKSNAEKLREVEDEFRKVNLEKAMMERDALKLRDEISRMEKDKASVDAYIKGIPEKERELANIRAEKEKELANMRADLAISRMREEKVYGEFKVREDKLISDIDGLQKEIGSISDRKNTERNEDLRKLQTRCEAVIQEKEKAVADITGEKMRAMSELFKMKGFISRVQAINAVLEKERQSLRLEKMQMAQAMASNIEDAKKLKSDMEIMKASHQGGIESLMKRYQAEIQKFKNDHTAEFAAAHARELAELRRDQQDEILMIGKKNLDELAGVKAASAADLDKKIADMRAKYEAAANDIRAGVKRELEQEYAAESARLKAQAEDGRIALEAAVRRGAEEARSFDEKMARVLERMRGLQNAHGRKPEAAGGAAEFPHSREGRL